VKAGRNGPFELDHLWSYDYKEKMKKEGDEAYGHAVEL